MLIKKFGEYYMVRRGLKVAFSKSVRLAMVEVMK